MYDTCRGYDFAGTDAKQGITYSDENDTDASFFPVSEDESILSRHMDDVVDTSPDRCHRHRAIGEMANPRNQHIETPQILYTDRVAGSIVIQRQISPRTTETKVLEHQQDDRSGGDAGTSKAKPLPNIAGQEGRR